VNPGTFVNLVLATAAASIATFRVHDKVRMLLYRDQVPDEAYRNLGLYMGVQSLAVGVLIGLCVSIPFTDLV
jgi:hypothetical protein